MKILIERERDKLRVVDDRGERENMQMYGWEDEKSREGQIMVFMWPLFCLKNPPTLTRENVLAKVKIQTCVFSLVIIASSDWPLNKILCIFYITY